MKQIGTSPRSFERRLIQVAVASCFAGSALANPQGPSVAAGAANFGQAGNTLTVTTSPGTVINWQAFSIGRNEVTRFVQQGAASAVLNRVTGTESSAILGQLLSNGRVFLINPNGVAIGAGARIDVAGFVASSLNLSNEDFLAGRMRFTDSGTSAKVENHGTINTAAGGAVYLVAPTVENHGVITAPNGDIVLAAGKSVELVASNSPDIRVQLNAPGDKAINVGELVGKHIGIYGGLIVNAGQVSATGASVDEAGNIVLKATKDVTLEAGSRLAANGASGGAITVQAETGTLLASGTIEVKGSSAAGGTVHLLGDRVGLVDHAKVDASGATGGGAVLVGGDYQGRNAAVQNASRTYVNSDATIKADAIDRGDGGKVIVWADGDTRYDGAISAKGGATVGNGGFVEVSGKQSLGFHGSVETSAANGAFGTLLLDPTNITVVAGATPNPPNAADGLWSYAEDPGSQNIGAGAINTLLNANNLTLQATNNITVGSAIAYNGASDRTLTLQANNNITVSQAISTSGGRLGVVMNADADASGAGTVAINNSITTRGGTLTGTGQNVTANGTGTISTAGAAGRAGGNVTLTANAAGAATIGKAIATIGGTAPAASNGLAGGSVSVTGGTVTVANITSTGSAGVGAGARTGGNAGSITLDANGAAPAITLNGNLDARGGAGVNGGTGGAGGAITALDPMSLTGNRQVLSAGGAGGTSVGGALQLGNVNSDLAAQRRTLTVTAGNAAATLGNLGAINPLGAVSVSGVGINAGSVSTVGVTNGAGAAVALNAGTGALTVGAIDTSGGARTANGVGTNAGAVTLTGNSIAPGAIAARGGDGFGANNAGGSGGAVQLNGSGTASTTTVTAAIDTRGGNSQGTGTGGAGGAVTLRATDGGSITSTVAATINTSGGRGQAGGTVTVVGAVAADTVAAVTLQGAITTDGGVGALGGSNGQSAGTVSVSQAETVTVGAISARGSTSTAATGVGGRGGDVNIDIRDLASTGALLPSLQLTGAVDTRGGSSTGAAPVAPFNQGGNIRLRGTAGGTIQSTAAATMNTSGGRSQPGGSVTITTNPAADTLAGVNLQGAITTNGGDGAPNAAGSAGGAVAISNAEMVTVGAMTTRGGNAGGGNLAGGAGGAVTIDARDLATTAATLPSINLSGAILTQGGDSAGTGTGGTGGQVRLRTSAGGAIASAAGATVTTIGGRGQAGGAFTVAGIAGADTLATVNLQGAVMTNGGVGAAGGSAGQAGGAVSVTQAEAMTVGPISTRGSNSTVATAAGAAGGNGGNVTLTVRDLGTTPLPPSMQLNGAIVTSGGDSTGTTNTGASGTVAITSATANGSIAGMAGATITTAGGRGQTGGNVTVTTTGTGTIDIAGGINTSGGTAATAGKAAGAVSVSSAATTAVAGITAAGGTAATGAGGNGAVIAVTGTTGVTLRGNLASTGGNGSGAAGGAGAGVTVTGPTTLAANIAIGTAGGTGTTTGAGGAVNFGASSTINSDATARSLTIASGTGATTLGAAVGATNALASASITGGAVSMRGVRTTGAQSYAGTGVTLNGTLQSTTAGAVAVTGPVTLAGASGVQTAGNAGDNVSFSSTINGAQSLAVNAGTAGNASFGGTIGQTTALTSLAVTAASATLPATRTGTLSVTTSGGNISQTGAVVATGATTLNTAGGTVTLDNAANDFGGAVSVTAGAATLRDTNALVLGASNVTGNLDVIANGAVTQTGALVVGGAATIAAGAANNITLANPGNDFNTVSITTGNAVNVVDTNALTVGASSVGTLTAQTLSGDLTLGGNVTATGAGNAIVLAAAGNFQNPASRTLAPGTGRWLVYSSSPAPTTNLGGLAPAFKRYNCTLAAGCLTPGTIIPAVGNGVLYSVAPTLGVTANGVSIVYGSAPSPLTYTATGFIDGDTAASALTGALARVAGGTSGSGNEVAGTTAIMQGTVVSPLGYQIAYTGANYTITPKALSAGLAGTVTKQYDATTAATLASGNYTLAGAIAGDAVALNNPSAGTYDTANVGTGKTVSVASLALLGADAGNYTVNPGASGAIGTITPATLTYTANAAARGYGDPNPLFSGTVTGFVGGETLASATTGTLAFSSPATTTSNVGSYAIDGSGLAANNGNYVFAQAPGNATALTITPASLLYVGDPASRVYGEPNPAFTGTVTGFKNGETTASATTGTLAFTSPALNTSNVGSYAIDGSGLTANNGNYTFAQAAGNAIALAIAQRPVTLTAGSASREYGDPNPAVGVTASPTGVGTGIASFESLASAFPALGASSGATGTTAVGAYSSGPNAYNVTGAANPNYAVTAVQGTLDITAATLTYTANAASRVYGEANPAFSGTVTGFKNGETVGTATTGTLAFTSPALTTSNVGTYAIDGSGLTANNGNYVFAQAAGNATALAITQRPITLTAGSASREYGDPNPVVGVTANPTAPGTGLASFDTLATAFPTLGAASGATATTNVGVYASGANAYSVTGATNGNYAVTTAQGTLTIDPATLAYVADPAARPYGEPNPAFTGTVTGFKNGDSIGSATTGTLAFGTTATQGSSVGSYPIDGSGLAANSGNYVFVQAPGNATALAVNPRPITIAANAGQGKVYGDADPVLAYSVANGAGTTGTPLYGSDALTGALARAAGENVGAYGINQGSLTPSPVASNYTVTFVPQNFAITSAPLSVVANPQTKVYGTADPALTYVATGFKFADTPATVLSGALARVAGEAVAGSPYAILQGSLASNANYTIAYTGAGLTITPAALTIAANNASRLYGDPNPPFSATFTGLANGDPSAAIPGVAFATPATVASNVGAYPITVSSGANPNYTITYVPGTLAIARAPLTITADDAAKRADTPNPPFTATGSGFKLGQGFGDLSGSLAFFTPATISSPAGAYPIVPSGVSSPNYDVVYVNGTLLVTTGLPPENQAYIVGLDEAARFPVDETERTRRVARRGIDCIELERRDGERRVLHTCY